MGIIGILFEHKKNRQFFEHNWDKPTCVHMHAIHVYCAFTGDHSEVCPIYATLLDVY